jgi:hypothetical protein
VRKSTIYLFVLGVAVVAMTALASAGLVVSAQNTNSSTTMAPTNTAAKKTPRRHKVAAAKTTGPCDPTKQEQTDLSGTYTGKLKHGDEAAVDATVTITGNNFTVTAGSDTHSGRITAVTTCGYTAVTMMSGDGADKMVVSLRAKKTGDRITLTSVPGEKRMVSFVSAGAAAKAPRKHRTTRKAKTGAPPPPTPKQ